MLQCIELIVIFHMTLLLQNFWKCKKQSTFYHFNNRDESQIDYFIESEPIVKTYITFQREFQNLSTHDPVMISIEVEIPETLISAKIPRKLRIKWEKNR